MQSVFVIWHCGWQNPSKKVERVKLHILLLDRSTFTFLVGISPSAILRTIWSGTSQKRHPVWLKIIENATILRPHIWKTRMNWCHLLCIPERSYLSKSVISKIKMLSSTKLLRQCQISPKHNVKSSPLYRQPCCNQHRGEFFVGWKNQSSLHTKCLQKRNHSKKVRRKYM